MPEAPPSAVARLRWRLGHARADSARSGCQLHSGLSRDFALAAITFSDTPKPKTEGKPEEQKKDELPREFVGQAIKHIVMHEVGHSLGLRHNFKASTMLSGDQLHDTAITRVKGLCGSVMDYMPINVAPKGQKQGDYFTTTIGPYDYWAIEYAYKPIEGNEEAELKKNNIRYEGHIYPDSVHGFFNDATPERYNKVTAQQAWTRTIDWFNKYVRENGV